GSGGMQLIDKASNFGGGGNGNNAQDWLAVPVGAPYNNYAGNNHWLLDGVFPVTLMFGVRGHDALHHPAFVATGTSDLGIIDTGSRGLNGTFSARHPDATVGQFYRG